MNWRLISLKMSFMFILICICCRSSFNFSLFIFVFPDILSHNAICFHVGFFFVQYRHYLSDFGVVLFHLAYHLMILRMFVLLAMLFLNDHSPAGWDAFVRDSFMASFVSRNLLFIPICFF